MEHEYPADWKQLGDLANGILRSVAEKRMKQAEFMAPGPMASTPRCTPRVHKIAFSLICRFSAQAAPPAELRAGRV